MFTFIYILCNILYLIYCICLYGHTMLCANKIIPTYIQYIYTYIYGDIVPYVVTKCPRRQYFKMDCV